MFGPKSILNPVDSQKKKKKKKTSLLHDPTSPNLFKPSLPVRLVFMHSRKKKKKKRKTHAIMLMVFRGKYKDITIFVFSLMVENKIFGLFLYVLEIRN